MSGPQVGKYFLSLNGLACIMGILNVTPDSFPDGGQNFRPEGAVVHMLGMQEQGAGMIDIGGQSTRPGFTAIPPQEEWGYIEPALKTLQGHLSVSVSADTLYPQVISVALPAGVDVTNDVNGFTDPAMFSAVLQSGRGCIIMHNGHVLEENPGEDILFRARCFSEGKLRQAQEIGIAREYVCFNLGTGSGKTYEGNLRPITNADVVRAEGCVFLMTVSCKGATGKSCGGPPAEDRMSGMLAAHTLAQAGGAQLLRVHDVRETAQAAQVAHTVLGAKAGGTSLG